MSTRSPINVTAYFCYERNFAREWKPKLYLLSPPPSKGMDGTKQVERSPVITLETTSDLMYGATGSGSRGKLLDICIGKYPSPKD